MSATLDQSELENQMLMSRLQGQDQSAIEPLYNKYSGALLHVIMQIIQEQEKAEEVLQDVFVKIWKKAAQYDKAKGRLFTWMVQIARNTAIDNTRSKSFQRQNKTESIDTVVNKDELGSELPLIKDTGLNRVINQLEEDQKKLIEYLYFKGFTQKETSEALGMPLGTVKTKIRKAILILRKVLTKETFTLIIVIELLMYFSNKL